MKPSIFTTDFNHKTKTVSHITKDALILHYNFL